MEGRAGRLGIKEKGHSYILPYGAKPHAVEEEIRRSMERSFTPYLREAVAGGYMSENLEKILSLFILIGFLYFRRIRLLRRSSSGSGKRAMWKASGSARKPSSA